MTASGNQFLSGQSPEVIIKATMQSHQLRQLCSYCLSQKRMVISKDVNAIIAHQIKILFPGFINQIAAFAPDKSNASIDI